MQYPLSDESSSEATHCQFDGTKLGNQVVAAGLAVGSWIIRREPRSAMKPGFNGQVSSVR